MSKKQTTKKRTEKPLIDKGADKKVAGPKKRVLKSAQHRSLRLTKKKYIKPQPLPSVRQLIKEPIAIVVRQKNYFLSLTFLYSAIVFVFIKGFGSAFDIVETKQQLKEFLGAEDRSLETSYSLFSYMLGSFNGQVSEAAGVYQIFLTVMIVLATIWACRKIFADEIPTLRDSLYKGMTPIVPFVIVLIIISLQLIPMAIGNVLFSTIIENGLAVTFLEKLIWFLLFIGTVLISLYMMLSSVFALNIVTLSDVRPFQALRSARNLVMHRRIGIFARILILPILYLIVSGIVFIPLLMFAPVLAEPLFLIASSFSLIFLTVYMYNFYRKLL